MRLRLVIGTLGVALILFGVFRLLTQVALHDLAFLLVWLIGALVLHDGILSPVIGGIGVAIERSLPPRARSFVQSGLVSGALITIIAIPMIYKAYDFPASKALLEQNFGANLGVLLGVVAGASLLLYVLRVVRDRASRPGRTEPS